MSDYLKDAEILLKKEASKKKATKFLENFAKTSKKVFTQAKEVGVTPQNVLKGAKGAASLGMLIPAAKAIILEKALEPSVAGKASDDDEMIALRLKQKVAAKKLSKIKE